MFKMRSSIPIELDFRHHKEVKKCRLPTQELNLNEYAIDVNYKRKTKREWKGVERDLLFFPTLPI